MNNVIEWDGKKYKVTKVTGIIAQILAGRNSYYCFRLIKPTSQKGR